MHLTPAGFPSGIPGIGEDIESAIQQAPQEDLHSIKNGVRALWLYGVMEQR